MAEIAFSRRQKYLLSSLLFVLIFSFYTAAQEPDPNRDQAFFPLLPLLETISSGNVCWQPDWIPGFPPDAFSVKAGTSSTRAFQAITVKTRLSTGEDDTLTLRYGDNGRLAEFPVFINGDFAQVSAAYGSAGEIRELTVTNADQSWHISFPEGFTLSGGTPVRINRGGDWYFVLFFEAESFLTETWYDGDVNFLAWHKASIGGNPRRICSLESRISGNGASASEDTSTSTVQYFDFDSENNITAITSPSGKFSAVYREGLPRYQEYEKIAEPEEGGNGELLSEKYTFQWDERPFLIGLKTEKNEKGEFRYEYETDGHGNWVSRQEYTVQHSSGIQFPVPGSLQTRHIAYGESGE